MAEKRKSCDVVDLTGDTDDEEAGVQHLSSLGVSPRSARRLIDDSGGDVALAAEAHFFPRPKRARTTADAAFAASIADADASAGAAGDAALAAALAAESAAATTVGGGGLDAMVAAGAIRAWAPVAAGGDAGAVARLRSLAAAAGHAAFRFASPASAISHRGPQRDSWSCGYRCLQTVAVAAAGGGAAYAAALRAGGLLEADGGAPSVRAVQEAIGRAWTAGFDPVGAAELGGARGLLGSTKWVGPVDCGAALRSCGLRANTAAADGRADGRDRAAREIHGRIARYFAGDDAAAFRPPVILCYGGHNVLVVGTAAAAVSGEPLLLLLDPKWESPRLRALAAGDLRCRRGAYEALFLAPGLAPAAAVPRDPNVTA